MRSRLSAFTLAAYLLLASFLTWQAATVGAAVAACAPDDVTDAAGDVARQPVDASQSDTVTGFGQIDLRGLCITETANETMVIVTVAATISTNQAQSFQWDLAFTVNSTTSVARTYAHASGAATSTPDGSSEHDGARIQFALPKGQFPLRSVITGLRVTSTGAFVPPLQDTVTGTDAMPDGGPSNRTYVVGARAPADQDSDADGVPDKDEIANNTDPRDPDSDGDGLNDGDEVAAGTDPTNADSDGDGLDDGDEVAAGTDPTNADSDGDGLDDGDEVSGRSNAANGYTSGPTNPKNPDTDGDGLDDGDEVNGETIVNGTLTSFKATDPNDNDTDNDGMQDRAEVEAGRDPTDPADGAVDPPPDEGGGGVGDKGSKDVVQYLPLSAVALLVIVMIGVGGIYWRWA